MLTIPQLETNTESSALLPWRSQIPMTVRYKIPETPSAHPISKHITPGELFNVIVVEYTAYILCILRVFYVYSVY